MQDSACSRCSAARNVSEVPSTRGGAGSCGSLHMKRLSSGCRQIVVVDVPVGGAGLYCQIHIAAAALSARIAPA